jgi:hypothetical protein
MSKKWTGEEFSDLWFGAEPFRSTSNRAAGRTEDVRQQ